MAADWSAPRAAHGQGSTAATAPSALAQNTRCHTRRVGVAPRSEGVDHVRAGVRGRHEEQGDHGGRDGRGDRRPRELLEERVDGGGEVALHGRRDPAHAPGARSRRRHRPARRTRPGWPGWGPRARPPRTRETVRPREMRATKTPTKGAQDTPPRPVEERPPLLPAEVAVGEPADGEGGDVGDIAGEVAGQLGEDVRGRPQHQHEGPQQGRQPDVQLREPADAVVEAGEQGHHRGERDGDDPAAPGRAGRPGCRTGGRGRR